MTSSELTTAKESLEEEFFRPAHGLDIEPYLALDDLSGIHHLARYHWVKQVLGSFDVGNVLDVACGAGYGSYLLADFLPGVRVTGADYDTQAIEFATDSYSLPNLNFVWGDLVSWKGGRGEPLGIYDAVVCFDTLEHVAHRDIALLRIAENLSGGGVLALSTPCAHSETLLTPPWRPHRIEYSHRDLKALLRHFFSEVLTPEDGTLPRLEFWTELNRDKNRYFNLANPLLCSGPIR